MSLPLHDLIASTRLLAATGVASLSLAVIWRMPSAPRDGTVQLLVLGGLCLAGLAAMSGTVRVSIDAGISFPGAAVRYVVPTFVFLCLAAALELGAWSARCSPKSVRAAVAIGLILNVPYAVGGVVAIARVAGQHPGIRAMPQRLLADWLRQRGLTYGVGEYWDTQLVTALSSGRVVTDPVTRSGGRLFLFPWLTDTGRFGAERPQFAIISPDSRFGLTLAAITATYGQPMSISKVADYYLVVILEGQRYQ